MDAALIIGMAAERYQRPGICESVHGRRRLTFALIVATTIPVVLDGLGLHIQAAIGRENTRR
jgi:hypothetical protein